MKVLYIQIVDPVENLQFVSSHRSPKYHLIILSVPSLVSFGHTFLLKLLHAQLYGSVFFGVVLKNAFQTMLRAVYQ